MRRIAQTLQLSALALALFMVGTIPDRADARTASVSLNLFKAGFIVGFSGGDGTMTYAGRRYELSIGGVSFGAMIGASTAELIGTASNLRHPSDIVGVYHAAQAGLAAGGGPKVFVLENGNGVILRLSGNQIGLEATLDLSGMSISIR